MKLFDRVRAPFTEKETPPEAKLLFPPESWLTPATESARFKMLWSGASGRFSMRLLSKFTPTSAVVVSMSGASEVMLTLSETEERLSFRVRSAS